MYVSSGVGVQVTLCSLMLGVVLFKRDKWLSCDLLLGKSKQEKAIIIIHMLCHSSLSAACS